MVFISNNLCILSRSLAGSTGLFFFLTASVMAQTPTSSNTSDADKVLGTWVSKAKDSKTEILKANGKYYGTLLAGWGNDLYEKDGKTLKKDVNNPNPALRSHPLLNAVILSNLTYVDGAYENGDYYDVRSGRTFSCNMRMRGDQLEIRIYAKFQWLGMTKEWTRVAK